MTKVLEKDVVYSAKLVSLYNYQTEVFEKFSGTKAGKCERIIHVVNFKKKNKERILCKKVTYTFLKLYIHELDRTIKIDIRSFLKNRYKGCNLSKQFLIKLQNTITREVLVKKISGKWDILDYDTLLTK